MIDLEVKTIETAPQAARSDLQKVQQKYRFVPNLMGLLQVLEVILGVATKTLSNYANHISATPLDSQFAAAAWSAPAATVE